MNGFQKEYWFLIALAVMINMMIIVWPSPVGYLNVLLLLLLAGTLVITRTWKDRGFYLVCGGEPLVVASGLQNIWAGFFAACMLAGIVCGALGLLGSRRDLGLYGIFCGSAFLIALVIALANHVLLPLLILGCMTAIVLAIQSVRTYQFRKHYTGGGT